MKEEVMSTVPTIINLEDLKPEREGAGSRFEMHTSLLGVQLGLFGLGATYHEVPPGKTASPFHRHHTSDEMFLVLSGTGTATARPGFRSSQGTASAPRRRARHTRSSIPARCRSATWASRTTPMPT
jgi:hypothetical protein